MLSGAPSSGCTRLVDVLDVDDRGAATSSADPGDKVNDGAAAEEELLSSSLRNSNRPCSSSSGGSSLLFDFGITGLKRGSSLTHKGEPGRERGGG